MEMKRFIVIALLIVAALAALGGGFFAPAFAQNVSNFHSAVQIQKRPLHCRVALAHSVWQPCLQTKILDFKSNGSLRQHSRWFHTKERWVLRYVCSTPYHTVSLFLYDRQMPLITGEPLLCDGQWHTEEFDNLSDTMFLAICAPQNYGHTAIAELQVWQQ
jgi:hypothetical protein